MQSESQTLDLPARFPLVTGLHARQPGNLPPLDAGLVNAFAEYNAEEDSWMVEKRPGYVLSKDYTPGGANAGFGAFDLNGTILQVFGTSVNPKLFVGDSTVGVDVFSVAAGARFIQIPFGTTLGQVIFGSGAGGANFIYDLSGTPALQSLGTYSGGQFPPDPTPLCKGFAYLDGTLYVMDINGGIWGSQLTDVSKWNALNVIKANETPDHAVYITNHLLYVVAMKEHYTQFFYDNANPPPGSPLSPLQGTTLPYGCANADTVQEIDSTLIWVSNHKLKAKQVVILDAMTASVISDPCIEKLLAAALPAQMMATIMKLQGHRYYVLTMKDLNATIVFDLDQKKWYYWSDGNGNYIPLVGVIGHGNSLYAQHISNGKLYLIGGSSDYPTDDGTVFPVDIYTPKFDAGVQKIKYLPGIFFRGDKVQGTLQVRCNDHDYEPTKWTNFRSVDLSLGTPCLWDNGSFYNRVLHMRYLAPTKFRISSVDLQMDIGDM